MSTVWEPDWPFRIYERIEASGFHALSEYMASRPMCSLLDLADELGPDIAAAQLESLWFREAEERGELLALLSSLLIRRIRVAIPQGWSQGDEFDFELAGGLASWGRVAGRVLSQSQRLRVRDYLLGLSPPAGWLPVVPHDTLTTRLHAALADEVARSQGAV